GDGTINIRELGTTMGSLGHHLTESELRDMIKKADFDGTAAIDFPEFLTMMANISGVGEDPVKEVFKKFDADGNGHINADELGKAMKELGENVSEDELAEMIREADADGDGLINYE
ncbi:hypothetical protein M407DRAFT_241347, partial [Tulasnella calospora MUT 4182]